MSLLALWIGIEIVAHLLGRPLPGSSQPARSILLKENERGLNSLQTYKGSNFWARTDLDGFILPSRTIKDHPYYIAFMGDSSVEATYLPPEKHWTSLVLESLRKDGWAHADGLVDAHLGATARDATELFYNKDCFFQPKILVYSSGYTDLAYNFVRGRDFPRFAPTQAEAVSLGGFLERNSYLFAYLQSAWKVEVANPVVKSGGGHINYYEADVSQPLADYRRNLQMLVKVARLNGCKVYLLTQPCIYGTGILTSDPGKVATIRYKDGGLSEATLEGALNQMNVIIHEVAASEGAECVEVASALGKNLDNYQDEVHTTEAGQKLTGEAVYAKIRGDFKTIPSEPSPSP